jgi:hypothetical protein
MRRSGPFYFGLLAVITVACDFSEDRTIGSMHLSSTTTTGGTTTGGTTSVQPSTTVGGTSPEVTASIAVSGSNLPRCDTASTNNCKANEFCLKSVECSVEVPRGTCEPIPTDCPLPTGKERVCGCDGQFYESLCDAKRVGVSPATLSFCPAVSCTSNDDCLAFSESCAQLFAWDAPQSVCDDRGQCSCGKSSEIIQ